VANLFLLKVLVYIMWAALALVLAVAIDMAAYGPSMPFKDIETA
jgi:hypothetical protein